MITGAAVVGAAVVGAAVVGDSVVGPCVVGAAVVGAGVVQVSESTEVHPAAAQAAGVPQDAQSVMEHCALLSWSCNRMSRHSAMRRTFINEFMIVRLAQ